jgi:hypothetical protein
MDRLGNLGSVLQGLAGEAAALKTGPSASAFDLPLGTLFQPGLRFPLTFADPLGSVVEARDIANNVVDALLVPAVTERLSETGEIMVNVADQFRNADDEALEVAVTTYTDATGDWDVPQAPQ